MITGLGNGYIRRSYTRFYREKKKISKIKIKKKHKTDHRHRRGLVAAFSVRHRGCARGVGRDRRGAAATRPAMRSARVSVGPPSVVCACR